MTSFSPYLEKAKSGGIFTQDEMKDCITSLTSGNVPDIDIAAFLTALHKRGETADEIAGAAAALREKSSTITAPDDAIDCCGTGGDGLHTYNISTGVAFVAAGCGVKIAKHGNRAASSKSGAADVLEKLGVSLSLSRGTLEKALSDIGFCFLMAPNHHAAMKTVAPVRKSLGHRTIFNLLGPLANPAGTKKQLIGVYETKWVLPVAQALKSLGTKAAMVVNGQDGIDEISLCAPTCAAILKDQSIDQKTIMPNEFGLGFIHPDGLKGGDAEYNAAALLAVLKGAKNAYRNMVLANTAAVLSLHDGSTYLDGVARAAKAIDDGAAFDILEKYKALSA